MKLFLKSDGFSLIEVLIAIVILSISLLALAGLMATTTRNTSFGGHLTEAATFAQDRLEELRVTPWASIVSSMDQVQGATFIIYTRSWNAVPTPAPPNDTLKTVTITINWTDSINHSFNIMSAIAR